jgi:N4-(beta-N-acetylglucosaminyl)-L-asparaginase
MSILDRRSFLAASAASAAPFFIASNARSQSKDAKVQATAGSGAAPGKAGKIPVVISSANGLRAVDKAMELIKSGGDPLDAIVAGINIVEDDPNDMSVGYGGLPNENGVVQLDSSCMSGPWHKAGSVAALENIKNPSKVALEVLRRTDHVMLVGKGALDFAKAMGFKEENLLTEESRQAWIKWKANLNKGDDWLDDDQQIKSGTKPDPSKKQARAEALNIPFTTGTIHCSAVDANGDIAACTSTSGLSWKIPGRIGDSPIIGAGMFCENSIGSAGATGRGEAVIQACGAFQIVLHMGNGLSPTEACLKVLQWIADHTRQPYLLNEQGRPNFGVTLYAVRKDGVYGSAAFTKGVKFAVNDGAGGRLEDCAALYA